MSHSQDGAVNLLELPPSLRVMLKLDLDDDADALRWIDQDCIRLTHATQALSTLEFVPRPLYEAYTWKAEGALLEVLHRLALVPQAASISSFNAPAMYPSRLRNPPSPKDVNCWHEAAFMAHWSPQVWPSAAGATLAAHGRRAPR